LTLIGNWIGILFCLLRYEVVVMSLACLVGVKDVCCTLVSCQWTIMAEHNLSSWRWIPLDESFLIRLHVYNWKHVTVYFFFFLPTSLSFLSLLLEIHIILSNLKSVLHYVFLSNLIIIILIVIFALKSIFNWFLFFNFIA
jgi:hypothetical protein